MYISLAPLYLSISSSLKYVHLSAHIRYSDVTIVVKVLGLNLAYCIYVPSLQLVLYCIPVTLLPILTMVISTGS